VRAFVTGDTSNLNESERGDLYFLDRPFPDGTVLIGEKLIFKSEINDLKKRYEKKIKSKLRLNRTHASRGKPLP